MINKKDHLNSFVSEVPDELCGSCGGTGEVMVPDGDWDSCSYHNEPCRNCGGSGSGKKALLMQAKRKYWIKKNEEKGVK